MSGVCYRSCVVLSALLAQLGNVKEPPQDVPTSVVSAHDRPVRDICFDHQGKTLFSVGLDSTLKVWSLEQPETPLTFPGHKPSICSVDVSPNGDLLASSDGDGKIHIWRLPELRRIKTFEVPANVWSVRFVGDDSLACGSASETVQAQHPAAWI